MGTDIHMIGEYWDWFTEEWVAFPIPDYFTNRNYKFFAALANVRNGYGFAGVFTHDPIKPLTDHRGFPEDIGRIAQDWTNGDCVFLPGRGEHSEGYTTLSELRSFDWQQSIVASGIVTLDEYEKLDPWERPEVYSGGVYGNGIEVCETDRKKYPLTVQWLKDRGYTHVRTYWKQPIVPIEFIDDLVTFLSFWKQEPHLVENPEDCVRILFDFDS